MAYISESDLLKELSSEELARLTGDPSGATINHERAGIAITRSCAVIDTMLHGKYGVPFESPPEIIIKIAADLAVAHLHEFYYKSSSLPPTIAWRKLNAMNLLKKIATGEIILTGYTATIDAPPAIVSRTKQQRLFSDEVLNNYGEE